MFLIQELYSIKLDKGGTMNTHAVKILEMFDKLKAIGEETNGFHMSAFLLCHLPESYDTIIISEIKVEDKLNFDFINSELIEKYNRKLESTITETPI